MARKRTQDCDFHPPPQANGAPLPQAQTIFGLVGKKVGWPVNPRPAKCLVTLLKEVNDAVPNRQTASDGMLGDAAHQARDSDHNPHILDGDIGVVTAIDITHSPAEGCDCHRIADSLQKGKDPRIKYVIWNRQIMSSSRASWTWRPYGGPNPHTTHLHLSVSKDKLLYDSTHPWFAPPSP